MHDAAVQPERSASTAGAASAPLSTSLEARFQLHNQVRSGLSWFNTVAVLSLVNAVILLAGGEWSFIVGLGFTTVAIVIGRELGTIATVITLVLSVGLAGVFSGVALLGRRGHRWAVIAGMLLYAVDGLLFVLMQDWLSVAFHLFALFSMFQGLKALNRLARMGPLPIDSPVDGVETAPVGQAGEQPALSFVPMQERPASTSGD